MILDTLLYKTGVDKIFLTMLQRMLDLLETPAYRPNKLNLS